MAFLLSPIGLTGVAFLALVIAYLLRRNSQQERYAALGATPPAIVHSYSFGLNIVLGMFEAVRNHKFHVWTARLLEKYNHTMELHMLNEVLVMTDDPENIKMIQDTAFWEFEKSEMQHKIFMNILGDAIFAMNGQEWKEEAALYRAHMSRVRQSDFAVTEKHIQAAFELLEKEDAEAGDIIDRQQLDVVTEVFCGESTNSLTVDRSPFRNSMEVLQKINSFRLLLGQVGVLLDVKWLAPSAVTFIDNYQDAMADKAFSRSGDSQPDGSICLIDDLISKGKTRRDVKNAVTSTLLAGKDPSATTMGFAFYEVAKRPYVFAKMKAEVEANIGLDKLPTLTDLHSLKYIQMVIKETLRDHHPLGFNSRVPTKDITLPRGGGPDGKDPVAILKGTQIIYGLLSLQHRNDLGVEKVNEWIPERWENWKPGNQWEYIPFNHGPRICIGQQFANFQMQYFFARLCQEFDSITLLPHSQPQEGLMKLELNTKIVHPIYARCVRRVRT